MWISLVKLNGSGKYLTRLKKAIACKKVIKQSDRIKAIFIKNFVFSCSV
jgi:hypothetical protein